MFLQKHTEIWSRWNDMPNSYKKSAAGPGGEPRSFKIEHCLSELVILCFLLPLSQLWGRVKRKKKKSNFATCQSTPTTFSCFIYHFIVHNKYVLVSLQELQPEVVLVTVKWKTFWRMEICHLFIIMGNQIKLNY